jgi:hypothetical protein
MTVDLNRAHDWHLNQEEAMSGMVCAMRQLAPNGSGKSLPATFLIAPITIMVGRCMTSGLEIETGQAVAWSTRIAMG